MPEPKTPVVFRKWHEDNGGDVIALFPTIPSDIHGRYCEAYEHVGQHGGANYNAVIANTSPAKPDEYESLAKELTARGYNLKPYKRASQQHHLIRTTQGK